MILLIVLILAAVGCGIYCNYNTGDGRFAFVVTFLLLLVVFLICLLTSVIAADAAFKNGNVEIIEVETIELEPIHENPLYYLSLTTNRGKIDYFYSTKNDNGFNITQIREDCTVFTDNIGTPRLEIKTVHVNTALRIWLVPFSKTDCYEFYVPADTISMGFIN